MRRASRHISFTPLYIAFYFGASVLVWGGGVRVVHALQAIKGYWSPQAALTAKPLGAYEWRDVTRLNTPAYDETLAELSQRGYKNLTISINQALAARDSAQYIQQLDQFVARAATHGLQVSAVAGDPSWAEPDNYATIGQVLAFVQHYNAGVAHPLSRLEFDIEPYATGSTNAHDVALALQSIVQYVAVGKQGLHLDSLDVGYALPFWLACSSGQACATTDLLQQIAEGSDDPFITVMDYRNATGGRDGSISLAKPFLTDGSSNLGVYLAQDVTATTPAKTTFHGKGAPTFLQALHTLDDAYKDNSHYSGEVVNNVPALVQELRL